MESFQHVWAAKYDTEEMPGVGLPSVHLQTWADSALPSCTSASSVKKGRSSLQRLLQGGGGKGSFLLKQELTEFSSIMISNLACCEIFSAGSCKPSSLALDAFSSMYEDTCQGTGGFCEINEINFVQKASPHGRDYSPGNKQHSITSVHVRKGRVTLQETCFANTVTQACACNAGCTPGDATCSCQRCECKWHVLLCIQMCVFSVHLSMQI